MVGKNVLLCMPKKANTDERRDQVPVLGELRVFFTSLGWVIGAADGATGVVRWSRGRRCRTGGRFS